MNKFAFIILSLLAVILFILMIIFESGDNENVSSVTKDSARRQAEQKVTMREQPPTSVKESRAVFQKSETYTSKVPANGLVAYYPFNDNADDASGNGNHGTVHGATLTEDRFGNPNSAYYFDGGSWIEVKDSPSLKPTNSITVCAWVNLEDREVDDYLRILTKHGEVTEAGGSHGSYQLITGRLKDRCAYNMTLKTNEKYNYTKSASESSKSGWHFVLGTWDGTTASVYHDGVLTGQVKIGGSILYDRNSLIIGKDGYYEHVNFTGCIDEVRIFNKGLNAREVIDLFNSN